MEHCAAPRLRATAVVRRDAYILLHRATDEPFWTLPGGGVRDGETAAEAVLRELREETGQAASCGDLMAVIESFVDLGSDNTAHQIDLCFDVALDERSAWNDVGKHHRGSEGQQLLEFQWHHEARLPEELYPRAMHGVVRSRGRRVLHCIERIDAAPLLKRWAGAGDRQNIAIAASLFRSKA